MTYRKKDKSIFCLLMAGLDTGLRGSWKVPKFMFFIFSGPEIGHWGWKSHESPAFCIMWSWKTESV